MSDLVSILIPAYNAERWIGETIRSALDQTWPRVEIVIVDDGSSDGTSDVVQAFRSRSINLVTQRNSGVCVARNAAYARAQGNFIQWLDADDLLAPDKIACQMQRFAEYGSDDRMLLSGATGTFVDDPAKASFVPTTVWTDLSPRELLVRKFTDNAHIVLHSWLIPRRLADEVGAWDVRLQRTDADGEYSSRLAARSHGMLFVPQAKCYYRKGISGSLSATRRYLDEEELLLRLLFENLLSVEDSAETRDACVGWLRLWATNYYLRDRRAPEIVGRLAAYLGRDSLPLNLPVRMRVAEALLGWSGARLAKATALRARAAGRRVSGLLGPGS